MCEGFNGRPIEIHKRRIDSDGFCGRGSCVHEAEHGVERRSTKGCFHQFRGSCTRARTNSDLARIFLVSRSIGGGKSEQASERASERETEREREERERERERERDMERERDRKREIEGASNELTDQEGANIGQRVHHWFRPHFCCVF